MTTKPTISIIGVPFSNFVRAVMLVCEEHSIPYTVKMEHKEDKFELRDKGLLKLNPFGKIPIAIVNDHTICETATIIRLLDKEYGNSQFQADDPIENALIDQWCAFASIYVDKHIIRDTLLEFFFPKGENGTVRFDVVEANVPKISEVVEILATQLGRNDYICGNQISLADFLLIPTLDYLKSSPIGEQLLPKDNVLTQYINRMRSRNSCQKVLVAK